MSSLSDMFAEYVVEPFKHFTVKDGIDILLLALVLYFVYRLVRSSRAWKLIIGLVILFVVSIMARAFEMSALSFIFGNFQQLGILAIIVLFQPEIRMALEKVGGTPISGIKGMSTESHELAMLNAQIDALCTAVSDLSRDKVGALIVIERTTTLSDFIKSGVYIDAAISPYILRNIFFNKAPLHDGAVIIRKSRICAAGCFLPLSTQEDIDKDLGTRHRAAIGITEISDSIVIVVSEETGTISLSVEGKLERNFNYNSLKQTLNGYLIPTSPASLGARTQKKSKKEDGGKNA